MLTLKQIRDDKEAAIRKLAKLTLLSVACAESITAIKSSKALLWLSSLSGSGRSALSLSII